MGSHLSHPQGTGKVPLLLGGVKAKPEEWMANIIFIGKTHINILLPKESKTLTAVGGVVSHV